MYSSCAWTRAWPSRICTNGPGEELRLVWPCSGTGCRTGPHQTLCTPMHTPSRAHTHSHGNAVRTLQAWEISVCAEGFSGGQRGCRSHVTQQTFLHILSMPPSLPRQLLSQDSLHPFPPACLCLLSLFLQPLSLGGFPSLPRRDIWSFLVSCASPLPITSFRDTARGRKAKGCSCSVNALPSWGCCHRESQKYYLTVSEANT